MLEWRTRLQRALSQPLPGVRAQAMLAPRPRAGWDPSILPEGLTDAAVLALIFPVGGEPHLLLTVRGSTMRQHTGQVALPGGRLEPGESPADGALREAEEEVGIRPASVQIVGLLTPLHVPVSRFLVHPIVGVADGELTFRVAETEVARVLEVPLDALLERSNLRTETRTIVHEGRTTPMLVPFFAVGGEKVWGATAMIVAELIEALRPIRLARD